MSGGRCRDLECTLLLHLPFAAEKLAALPASTRICLHKNPIKRGSSERSKWEWFLSPSSDARRVCAFRFCHRSLQAVSHSLQFAVDPNESELTFLVERLFTSDKSDNIIDIRPLGTSREIANQFIAVHTLMTTVLITEVTEKSAHRMLEPLKDFLTNLAPLSLFGVEVSRGDGFIVWLSNSATGSNYDTHLRETAAMALLDFSVVSGSLQGLLLSVMVTFSFPQLLPYVRTGLCNLNMGTYLSKKKLATVTGPYDALFPISLLTPARVAIVSTGAAELCDYSIASNGEYLYIYDEGIHAILKVGSGLSGTLQGHQYGSQSFPFPIRSMTCIASKQLLFLLVAKDSSESELTMVTLSTENFSVMEFPNLELALSPSASIFSCADSLFIHQDGTVFRFAINSPTMTPQSSLKLEIPLECARLSFSPSCCSFYTNESFHAAVVSISTQDSDAPPEFIMLQWGTLSGRILAHSVVTVNGRACCYDSINNVIWNYSPFGQLIGYFINKSSAPRPTPSLAHVATTATSDDLLRFIVEASSAELPAPTEKIVSQPGRRPYTLEPTLSCIETLSSLLAKFHILARDSAEDKNRLVGVLAIMQSHLFAAVAETDPFVFPPNVQATLESLVSDPKLSKDARSSAARCIALGWCSLYPDLTSRFRFWQKFFLPLIPDPDFTMISTAFIKEFVARHDVLNHEDVDLLIGFAEPHLDEWRTLMGSLLALPSLGGGTTRQLIISLVMALVNKVNSLRQSSSPASALCALVEVLVASCVVRIKKQVDKMLEMMVEAVHVISVAVATISVPTPLARILPSLTRCMAELSATLKKEGPFEKYVEMLLKDDPPLSNTVLVESPHPIVGCDESTMVEFPGSPNVILEFAQDSPLAAGYIQLYFDKEKNKPVCLPLRGQLPGRLVIPGDRVCIHIHYPRVSHSPSEWGFKCYATALRPTKSSSSASSTPTAESHADNLLRILAKMVSHIIRGLVKSTASADRHLDTVLASAVLKNGLAPASITQAPSFITNLLNIETCQNKEDIESAATFLRCMRSLTFGRTAGNAALEAMENKLAAIFMVMRKQGDATASEECAAIARKFREGTLNVEVDIPEWLSDVWALVHYLRQLVTKKVLERTAQMNSVAPSRPSDSATAFKTALYAEFSSEVTSKAWLLLRILPSAAAALSVPELTNFLMSTPATSQIEHALVTRARAAECRAIVFVSLSQLVTDVWAPYAVDVLQKSVGRMQPSDEVLVTSFTAALEGAPEAMQTRAAQAVRLFASSLRRALTVYPPVTFPPLAISAISFWMRGIDLDTEEDLQLVRSTELLPFLESLVVPPVPKRTTKLSPTEMTLLYLQSEMSHLAGLGITAIALRCASLNYLPKAGRKVVRRLPTIMLEVARAPIASALAHQILDALVVLLASMAGKEAVKEFRNSEALQALFMLLESSLGEHDATLQDLVFQILKQVLLACKPTAIVEGATTVFSKILEVGMRPYNHKSFSVSSNRPLPRLTYPCPDPRSAVPYALCPRDTPMSTIPTVLSHDIRTESARVAPDGLSLSSGAHEREFALAVSDQLIPTDCGVFYFEVTVAEPGQYAALAIGIYPAGKPLSGLPGWYHGSYGFHADDGNKFTSKWEGSGAEYGPSWSQKGDTVGLLFDRQNETVTFFCNGNSCGTAFVNVSGEFYAAVAVGPGAEVAVNFGQRPFACDASVGVHLSRRTPIVHSSHATLRPKLIQLLRHLHASPAWASILSSSAVETVRAAANLLASSSNTAGIDYSVTSAATLSLQMVGGFKCSPVVGTPVVVDRQPAIIIEPFPSAALIVANDDPISLATVPLAKIGMAPSMHAILTGFNVGRIAPEVIKIVQSPAVASNATELKLVCVRLLGALVDDPVNITQDCIRSIISSLVRLSLMPLHRRASSLGERLSVTEGLLAALERRLEQINLAVALSSGNRPSYPRRNSRQMPTKSGSADRALRRAMDEGGFTFSDIRNLRDNFLRHDTDGDGEISETDFHASMVSMGSTDAINNSRLFASMNQANSNGKISFLDFVQYRAKQKLLKSGRIHDTDAHVGFKCADCGEQPIRGERYCSAIKVDYSLCGKCYSACLTKKSKKEPVLFYRVRVPFPPKALCPPSFRDTVYNTGEDALPLLPKFYDFPKASKAKKHGVNCSVCSQEIYGCRFIDVHSPNVSLCTTCDASSNDRTRIHLLVEVPLPPGSITDNSSALLPPLPVQPEPEITTIAAFIGADVTIARKDTSRFGFWTPPLDKFVGEEGVVVRMFEAEDQVQVLMARSDMSSSQQPPTTTSQVLHWFPLQCLGVFHKMPFKLSNADLITEIGIISGELASLLARRAVIDICTRSTSVGQSLQLSSSVSEAIQPTEFIQLIKVFALDGSPPPPPTPELTALLKPLLTVISQEAKRMRRAKKTGKVSMDQQRQVADDTAGNTNSSSNTNLLHSGPVYENGGVNSVFSTKWYKRTATLTSREFRLSDKNAPNDTPALSCFALSSITSVKASDKTKGLVGKKWCIDIVTDSTAILLATKSEQMRTEWVSKLQAAIQTSHGSQIGAMSTNSSSSLSKLSSLPSSASLPSSRQAAESVIGQFLDAAIANIARSPLGPAKRVIEESAHPYAPGTAIKRYISVPGATSILVVFDPDSHTEAGVAFLSFWRDAALTQPLAVFHGRGYINFSVTEINASEFWLTFEVDGNASGKYWGYKFWAIPLVAESESEFASLSLPQFSVGAYMIEWLASVAAPPLRNDERVWEALVALGRHGTATGPSSIINRTRALGAITKLLRCIQVPKEKATADMPVDLVATLARDFDDEREFLGLTLANAYPTLLQALSEATVAAQAKLGSTFNKAIKETPLSSSQQALTVLYKALKSRSTSESEVPFSQDFIKRAFDPKYRDKLNSWLEESSHPHLVGTTLASAISFQGAKELIIKFDARCYLVPGNAVLVLETVSGLELGRFDDNFPKSLRVASDSLTWKFVSDRSYPEWGFRFTVTPVYDRRHPEASKLQQKTQRLLEIALATNDDWSMKQDEDIVRWVNATSRLPRLHSDQSKPSGPHESLRVSFAECDLTQLSSLFNIVNHEEIEARFEVLRFLNWLLVKAVPLVDLRKFQDQNSPGELFSRYRKLWFAAVKSDWLTAALTENSTNIIRPRLMLRRRGHSAALFQQAFDQLSAVDSTRLRRNDRAFEVVFKDEGAQDAGGPYREAITQICQEMQVVPGLFLPTPNNVEQYGPSQDSVLPNPQPSDTQAQYLVFVGQMIGIAIRTRNPLALLWPPLIWKAVVGLTPDVTDLREIDFRTSSLLEQLTNEMSDKETDFSQLEFQTFTTTSTLGEEVPLLQSGADVVVTWENRLHYAELLQQFKLNEFSHSINLIINGIESVIPRHYLMLFTAEEAEARVCGLKNIDVTWLRQHTKYNMVDPSSPHIKLFWKVLGSFTEEQKRLFLRFVSGRSRLPDSITAKEVPFVINRFLKEGNHDQYFPQAHTCFFSLDLPLYSSEEIMRKRLAFAISSCTDIDGDFLVTRQ